MASKSSRSDSIRVSQRPKQILFSLCKRGQAGPWSKIDMGRYEQRV
jgi:hypothetical protein